MYFTRRTILKITGVGFAFFAFLPKMVFAATNTIRTVRTGVQPGNKTRLVIETALRPNYSINYETNKIIITLSNTTANNYLNPSLAGGTLVKSITQVQSGNKLQIIADLLKPVNAIPKDQIMVLSPNGDNDYRLVLDFVAGQSVTNNAKTEKNENKNTSSKK